MKSKILVGLMAPLVMSGAFAQQSVQPFFPGVQTSAGQTNVSIYGVIDTTLRYKTNANAAGNSAVAFSGAGGQFQGDRIGFTGVENLGGGNAAVFVMESGFNSTTGAFAGGGQLFFRQNYLGLMSTDLGEVDVGRQYGAFYNVLGTFDINGWGDVTEQQPLDFIIGTRYDNAIEYGKKWGPIFLDTQYSVGGQAGAASAGATEGIGLKYSQDALSFGGGFQRSMDANSQKLTALGIGAGYIFGAPNSVGSTKVLFSYLNVKRDPNFTPGANSTAAVPSSAPLANSYQLSNAGNVLTRTDKVWTLGALYQATPTWAFTAGYVSDNISNEVSSGDSGSYKNLFLVADYAFSKRTDVYVELDESKIGGAEVNRGSVLNGATFNGKTTRFAAGVGLRVRF